ncbi:hypothetical protein OGK28_002182 [Staphylococcus pseudintermedius]|uniref:hypothetical protein n=1 Tax=Staphylococcus pseudintermedius TaxID=283734 RepID=UPI0019319302|nr:hypothetical protein [Staphylococcus pseudintermedius]EGQ3331932.1 hypothetical protein [Staphylococcus pseudintermedius]EGQ3361293.1 hypothetical protein [Staphylococcus pseudintermedius]EGQ3591911.1 hypothetical protein [Staphylococcus pseudintermedius]EGQ3687500.1 hypothetical protein [Staphylococcus pseudintermedius]
MCSSTYLTMPTHLLPPIGFLKSIAILPHLLIDLMTSISLHSLSCLTMCSSTCSMMPTHLLPLIDFLKSIAISPHLLNDLMTSISLHSLSY